jgi:hypothetical protein
MTYNDSQTSTLTWVGAESETTVNMADFLSMTTLADNATYRGEEAVSSDVITAMNISMGLLVAIANGVAIVTLKK